MIRKLCIILSFITFYSHAMENALCKIPNAIEAFYALNTSAMQDYTLNAPFSDIYPGVPLLISTLAATFGYTIYKCIRHPTEHLQGPRILAPLMLRIGANPFKCVEIVESILVNDRNYDNQDNNEEVEQVTSCAAIHRAALTANLSLLRLYLAHKKQDDNIDVQNNFGETALILACSTNHKNTAECVRILVENGACLQAINHRGLSPLHFAAYNESREAVKELLASDVEINALDHKGSTPFHYAAKVAFEDGLILLLQAGALPDVENKQFKTPLDVANEHLQVVPILLGSRKAQNKCILSKENPHFRLAPSQDINIAHKLFNRELGI